MGARVICIGLGNACTQPLGYVIILVQVEGVQGYDEDQIALVVGLGLSNFTARIPIILGTLTISHIVNVMKEREIDALVTLWMNARVAHLLSVCRVTATEVNDRAIEDFSWKGYNELVYTKSMEIIDAFSSHVIYVQMERTHTGYHMNVMMQALQTKDGSLLQGLTIQNAYTELRQGSRECCCKW